MEDEISKEILKIIMTSEAPLETKEVFERIRAEVSDVSRSKLMYRLNILRGDGEIQGKSVGSGKGVWIWWKADMHK
jgi:repressor of nif and glnA expression